MVELTLDQVVLRYCRQVVMEAMDHVRSRMREENRAVLWRLLDAITAGAMTWRQ